MTPNQYRCETCKKEHHYADMGYRSQVLICEGEELSINCENFTECRGCASHSDFQSERDKVLDDLTEWVKNWIWYDMPCKDILKKIEEFQQAGE